MLVTVSVVLVVIVVAMVDLVLGSFAQYNVRSS